MYFYEILQSIMDKKKLTVADVARLSGLTDSTVRSIITRKNKTVALEVAFKISKGLDVSLQRLNGEEELETDKDSITDCNKQELLTFGDRLREARLQKGLTQEQLAQKIGVAKSTLTGYERGNREPDVFKIKRILEILEVDSNYLLGVSRELELRDPAKSEPEGYSLLNAESKKIVDNLVTQLLEMQENGKQ